MNIPYLEKGILAMAQDNPKPPTKRVATKHRKNQIPKPKR